MFAAAYGRTDTGVSLFCISADLEKKVTKIHDTVDSLFGSSLSGVLGRKLAASYTIELSFLVPLIFAVFFLILQLILYVHDTVWTDAWLCTKNQVGRWQLENGGEAQDFTKILFDETPRLVVLRLETADQTERNNVVTTEAVFRFCLLPEEVRILVPVFPETVERCVIDSVQDIPGWMRKVGAASQEKVVS